MNDDDIDLRSVNWEHGMLLTPHHFLRQERYVDSMLLWALRYCTDAYGLVGAGARAEPAERGSANHDPAINVHDDGNSIKVSVSRCRGVSPAGNIIEIDPAYPIHQSFSRQELEGNNELGIYVICDTRDKVVEDTIEDTSNPLMKSSRRHRYRVELGITGAEAPQSLMLGRIRKSEGSLRYEKVSGFIPVCTTLVGHSSLVRAWERLTDQVVWVTDRYTRLHKAIVEYISMASPRGISTKEDEETLQFVGRMVVTLESCVYEILNPLQSPQQFFQHLYRGIRSAAVYLDLSPPTKDYFRQIAEAGETEFGTMLEQENQLLLTSRELTVHDNLGIDVQRIEQALNRLRRLEEALEGKYLDFRVSTALESLNFFFDRQFDSPVLFQSVAKPARPQLFGNELTFVFAPLRLEGRLKYRLVLVGTPEAHFEIGENLGAEIKLNVGTGQSIKAIYGNVRCEVLDQRNFAIDFDAPPDIHTISDLRVIVNAAWSIKSCLLYVRRFLQAGAARVNSVEQQSPKQSPPPAEPATEVRRLSRLSRPEEPMREQVSGNDARPPRRRLE